MGIPRSPRSLLAAGLLLATTAAVSACDTAAVPVIPGSSVSTGGGAGGSSSSAGGAPSTGSATSSSSGPVTPKSYWAKRFGDGHAHPGESVAVSPAGNVAVFGEFRGTLDLGLGPLESVGPLANLFVAVFDPGGNPVWNRNLKAHVFLGELAGAVAFAGEDLIVAGSFSGLFNVDLGQGDLSTDVHPDVFIARFDPHGQPIWTKRFGDVYKQSTVDLVTDAEGNAYLSGNFEGSIDFGTGPFNFGLVPPSTPWTRSVFLVKLDPSGKTLAATAFNGQKGRTYARLAVDAHGHVYMAGVFGGEMDFGTGELDSGIGKSRLFAAAYDADLHPIYAKLLEVNPGDTPSPTFFDVAADSSGNVVISGASSGPIDLGGGALYGGAGEWGTYLLSLDPAGNRRWDRELGPDFIFGNVALGADSEVLLAGLTMKSLDLGLGLLSVPENSEALVLARFDPNGTLLGNRCLTGDSATVSPGGMALSSAGDLVLTGKTGGALDFGFGPSNDAPGPDLLVAQLPPP